MRDVPVDLLCFSHLRWDFVYQRPNHLLSRAARHHRAYMIEEPVRDAATPFVAVAERQGVRVVVPHIAGGPPDDESAQIAGLVDALVESERIHAPLLWYYTPMALPWSAQLLGSARAVVYDCMDHLAGFRGAPEGLDALEARLLAAADLVFTGGQSLYESRRAMHPSVHCLPSSVDVRHFARARHGEAPPADQAAIAGPRIGYFGVLDERIDWDLLEGVAHARPDWQLVLVGPTAKVDPAGLPRAANLHYLGPRSYDELPAYLAGWDAAMMPFARNEATRFISPTKTPEYLAGGRPVASTSIHDVVEPYGRLGLVHVGDALPEFTAAIEAALGESLPDLWRRADRFLAGRSWDATWAQMEALIEGAGAARSGRGDGRRAHSPASRMPARPAVHAAALLETAPLPGGKG